MWINKCEYLTFPKFRVTLIFARKRCAKIKLTIFAHDGCAKIKTSEIFCLGTLLYNDTVVVTMFNQYFKPLCKTTQIVAILFHCLHLFHLIFLHKIIFRINCAKIKSRETSFSQGARKCAKIKRAKIKTCAKFGESKVNKCYLQRWKLKVANYLKLPH